MLTDQFELDPERRLWKPNRRSFFFGLGAALIAPMLPKIASAIEIESPWFPSLPIALGKGNVLTFNGNTIAIGPEVVRILSIQGSTITIERQRYDA